MAKTDGFELSERRCDLLERLHCLNQPFGICGDASHMLPICFPIIISKKQKTWITTEVIDILGAG